MVVHPNSGRLVLAERFCGLLDRHLSDRAGRPYFRITEPDEFNERCDTDTLICLAGEIGQMVKAKGIYFKTYESRYGVMVAACDAELSGKHLKFKKIDFFVNPRFYGEEKVSQEELVRLLRKSTSCNLVGQQAVECGIKAGLITEDNILKIGKVPHAQGVVMIL